MKEGQEAIYYITADTLPRQEQPALEVFRQKGIEVLLMTDRVDEWALQFLTTSMARRCNRSPRRRVDPGKLQDEAEKKAARGRRRIVQTGTRQTQGRAEGQGEGRARHYPPRRLGPRLVVEDGNMSTQMARMLEAGPDRTCDQRSDSRSQRRTRTGEKLDGVHRRQTRFWSHHIVFDQAMLAEAVCRMTRRPT